jgi:dCMP deaminase
MRMSRPSRTETLMRQAQAIAERSTCSRAHVGVVIALEGRVISQGYNGAPASMPHCNHECGCATRLIVYGSPSMHSAGCPAQGGGCRTAVHAEANAVAFAARYGVPTNGAFLYTTMAPCLPCSQLIINAGIVRVYWLADYRDDAGTKLLKAAKVGLCPWRYPDEQTS